MPVFKNGRPVETLKKPLVLFGSGQWAEYTAYMLEVDAGASIAGFSVDDEFVTDTQFYTKPLVPFTQMLKRFSPDDVDIFVSVGFLKNNLLRQERLRDFVSLGYEIVSYVSCRASVWPNLGVAENVAIHEGAIVQPFCEVGRNTHILSGVNISHHTKIAENTFVAGSVCLAGDVKVGSNCFLGINSSVIEGRAVGDFVTLGAGSVLTNDALKPGLYVGAPARLVKPLAEQPD